MQGVSRLGNRPNRTIKKNNEKYQELDIYSFVHPLKVFSCMSQLDRVYGQVITDHQKQQLRRTKISLHTPLSVVSESQGLLTTDRLMSINRPNQHPRVDIIFPRIMVLFLFFICTFLPSNTNLKFMRLFC